MSKIIGIDISKSTFDVSYLEQDKWEHKVFKNQSVGFEQFKKILNSSDWIVMEASGPYYVRLATFLNLGNYAESDFFRLKTTFLEGNLL